MEQSPKPSLRLELILQRKDLCVYSREFPFSSISREDFLHGGKDIEQVDQAVFIDDDGRRKVLKYRDQYQTPTRQILRPDTLRGCGGMESFTKWSEQIREICINMMQQRE